MRPSKPKVAIAIGIKNKTKPPLPTEDDSTPPDDVTNGMNGGGTPGGEPEQSMGERVSDLIDQVSAMRDEIAPSGESKMPGGLRINRNPAALMTSRGAPGDEKARLLSDVLDKLTRLQSLVGGEETTGGGGPTPGGEGPAPF